MICPATPEPTVCITTDDPVLTFDVFFQIAWPDFVNYYLQQFRVLRAAKRSKYVVKCGHNHGVKRSKHLAKCGKKQEKATRKNSKSLGR